MHDPVIVPRLTFVRPFNAPVYAQSQADADKIEALRRTILTQASQLQNGLQIRSFMVLTTHKPGIYELDLFPFQGRTVYLPIDNTNPLYDTLDALLKSVFHREAKPIPEEHLQEPALPRNESRQIAQLKREIGELRLELARVRKANLRQRLGAGRRQKQALAQERASQQALRDNLSAQIASLKAELLRLPPKEKIEEDRKRLEAMGEQEELRVQEPRLLPAWEDSEKSLRSLEADLSAVRLELEQAKGKASRPHPDVVRLEADKETQAQEARKKLEEQSKAIETLRKQLRTAQEEHELQLQALAEQQTGEIASQQAEVSALQQERQEKDKKIEELAAQLQQLQKKLEEARNKNEALQSLLAQSGVQCLQYQNDLRVLTDEIDSSHRECSALQAQQEEEKEVARLECEKIALRVADLEKEVHSSELAKQKEKEQRTKAEQELQNYQRELAALQRKYASLRKTADAEEEQCRQDLTEQRQKYEAREEELRQALFASSEHLKQLVTEHFDLQGSKLELEKQIKQLEEERKQFQKVLQSQQDQVEAEKGKTSRLRFKNSVLKDELRRLEETIEAQRTRIGLLEEESAKYRRPLSFPQQKF